MSYSIGIKIDSNTLLKVKYVQTITKSLEITPKVESLNNICSLKSVQ